LTSPSALKPTRVSPHGDACVPRYSPSSTTDRVTPRIVKSPVSVNVPSPWSSAFVDRNVACRCDSLLKKSEERRCSSRLGSPVSTAATSIVASTDDVAGSEPITSRPSTTGNRPRTLLTIR
jgi:hypothetical protein